MHHKAHALYQVNLIGLKVLLCIWCCVQVLLSTATCCWGMTSSAKLVVIMGTQYYDGTGLGASDYPVTDLLQMLGRASRPGIDEARTACDPVVWKGACLTPACRALRAGRLGR